ncbi:hypothetical protein SB778_34805, partial [Paraburkholderia sp. SIMBA_050]
AKRASGITFTIRTFLGIPSQRQIGFVAAHPYAIAVDAIELQTAIGSPRSYVREVARDIR